MCTSCISTLDTAATNSVLLIAAASNGWERVKDRLDGRSRLERRQRTWEENAALLRSMDLDPLETLGAPPAVPAVDDVPVAR